MKIASKSEQIPKGFASPSRPPIAKWRTVLAMVMLWPQTVSLSSMKRKQKLSAGSLTATLPEIASENLPLV